MNDIRASIPSSNYGVGRTHAVDTIVFHHIVGDALAAIARFRQPNVQVSSTYIIGSDGQVYYTVSESNTPYTNGDYSWNTRSITIEHAGGIPSVPYTDAMYSASASLVRDIMSRYNITNFKRHREIVATACPGGLDVERIMNEAKGNTMPNTTIETMRIGQTEERGSDYDFVHSGKFDKQLLAAYSGTEPNSFVYNSFVSPEAVAYRENKKIWQAFYTKYSVTAPTMEATIAAQNKEIKDLQAQLALQSDDTKNLNALGSALQWFVKRVGLK